MSNNTSNTFRGFITAMRTLSILPVPGRDADSMAFSLPWFPLAGGILGAIVYGLAWLSGKALGETWYGAVAFAAVTASIMLTRGFHLDGLSDWADSLGSTWNREKALQIMKDSRVGVFGVLALVIVLLGKWIFLTRLFELQAGLMIIPAYIVSRTMQVVLATSLPYARPEGGTAASFVSDSRPLHKYVAVTLCLILLAVFFGVNGLIAFALGLLTCAIFGIWCKRTFGGVTGDLLGTCSEMVETVLLLAFVLIAQR